jgi:hypothetical protein
LLLIRITDMEELKTGRFGQLAFIDPHYHNKHGIVSCHCGHRGPRR